MNHASPAPAPALPRDPATRGVLASLLWLALWSPVLLLAVTGMQAAVPIKVLAVLLPLVVLALFLPRVGYRRRDVLFLFVPVWGIKFSWMVSHRLAGLPHVDWPVRAERD